MTNRRIPYVYIAGLSHSGSTLLAFLLNAHPDIVSIGEADRVGSFLPDRWATRNDLCSCGRAFYACDFWNRTLAGLAARGFGLQSGDPFQPAASDRRHAQRKWRAFVEATLEVSGARVFVDASKVTAFIQPLLANRSLDVKVINLVRDGRGVFLSWKKRLPDSPPESILQAWMAREQERATHLQSVHPQRVKTVRYERLCSHTAEVMQEIFTFIGVNPEVEVTRGYKTAVEHHVIGNQMRLSGEEAIFLDEKWRRELTDEEMALFAGPAGDINARNGYER